MGRIGPAGDAADLTGVWQGLYSYAGAGEPVSFMASLLATGAVFSGTTHEVARFPGVPGAVSLALGAFVEGALSRRRVHFIKTYDGSAGWSHSVAYEGLLNGEGTEIEGRWHLADGLAGRFLMVRPARAVRAAPRKALAEV
jgi:hypothetical protein